MLSSCLEPIKLPYEKTIELFNTLSQKQKIGNAKVVSLTFPLFAIGCIENDLFTQEVQQQFLQVQDMSKCYEKLQELKPIERIKLIKERFSVIGKLDAYMNKWIRPIENAIQSNFSKEAKIIFIKLKLIEAESKRQFAE